MGVVDRLEAIAYPSRLELLHSLQEAKPIGSIEIEATTGQGSPDRCITREGVRHHLNKLRETGLVDVEPAVSEGRHEHTYRTRHSAVYELAENLRAISANGSSSTQDLTPPITWDAEVGSGPTLTVVHGAPVGTSFSLSGKPTNQGRGWVVGTGTKADLPLDWDPHVEDQAVEIVSEADGYAIVDLRAAEHRVSLNGRKLERGAKEILEHGDLIGVGSTLLAFREP